MMRLTIAELMDPRRHADYDPPCAACGARWEDDGIGKTLVHHEGCAYVAALKGRA